MSLLWPEDSWGSVVTALALTQRWIQPESAASQLIILEGHLVPLCFTFLPMVGRQTNMSHGAPLTLVCTNKTLYIPLSLPP